MSIKKKLYIKTYGCQMNVYDSGRMADILAPHGYAITENQEEANLIILNTCHIREKATEKVYSELGRLHQLKEERAHNGDQTIIAVAGCVAQAEGEEILRRAPYVDMVFGPQTYHLLPEMIAQATRAADKQAGPGRGIVNVDFPVESKFDYITESPNPEGASAFLTIQEGCDKFCHFCCVPYTRGAEYSRPASAIIAEAKTLIAKGVCEITLLGQNVNAYHGLAPIGSQEWGLGRLMRELAEIEGLKRISYTTSHPRDVDDELIAAHRDVAKIMPYLHLPVQSGSDRILKAMNRRHTSDDYRRIIASLRAARPDLAFSSDFIVGYPGETDADFEATLQLVRDIEYAQAYSFKYSRRPGTPAAALDDQIPEVVKEERLEQLQQLLREQQTAFNQSLIGTQQSVLFEKKGRHTGQIIGRSPYLQSVYVQAPERLIGHIVDVHITGIGPNSLTGDVITMDVKAA